MRRAKRDPDDKYRGSTARKQRYGSGLTMPLMVTQEGQPVACVLTHRGCGDVEALPYDADALPEGAISDADPADHADAIEDLRQAVAHMHRIPRRKKNAKRALPP
jgi:hypothetical protein